MKISRIRSQILVMPQEDPLANTPEDPNAARPMVIVRLDTDDGIEGIGVTFYGGAMTASLQRAVDDLGALTVGEDPLRVEAIIAKLRAAAGGSGPAGMFTLALAAIDIALWDIRGKALNQPLWKLLGGARRRVPAYAGAARRHLARQGGRAHAASARGDRARHQADVRHQPALAGRAGDRYRQAGRRRRRRSLLARGCDSA